MAGVKGKVALVTGAGSGEGIGFACARALAEAGASVAVTSTTARITERLVELGDGHAAFIADLTDPIQAKRLVEETVKRFGRIDILINNAGMVQTGHDSKHSRLEELSDGDWRRHLDLNVTTAFNVIRAVLPAMRRENYGRIVNIASVTGPVVAIPC